MPFYEFTCLEGHRSERRFGFADCPESVYCACGQPASRAVVNHIGFYGTPTRSLERLSDVREAGLDARYLASRTDDPQAKVIEHLGHAAMVRAEARLLTGENRFDVQTGVAT